MFFFLWTPKIDYCLWVLIKNVLTFIESVFVEPGFTSSVGLFVWSCIIISFLRLERNCIFLQSLKMIESQNLSDIKQHFCKIVNQTLEKSIKKARLDLMIRQQIFYNTEATLLKTLQGNWRNYAKCYWFFWRLN